MVVDEREPDSNDEPQVFMMPVNRDRWLDEFKRTVDQSFDFGPEDERPAVLQGLGHTRIWGTRTGERNESMWESLSPGDIMLFYCNGWFFSAARIDDTLRSSGAGEYIWNNKESQFIYTVQDYHRIAIRKLEVWDWFRYSENFTRRGLSRVAPERVESFRKEVGNVWSYIMDHTVDAEIDEVLEGTVESQKEDISAYFILKTGGGGYEDQPERSIISKRGSRDRDSYGTQKATRNSCISKMRSSMRQARLV